MSTIEVRNGRGVRVTESKSLIDGSVSEFVEPLDDGDTLIENAAIHNVPGSGNDVVDLPVLKPPVHNTVKTQDEPATRFSNGLPTLETPKWKPRADKSVKNDPRKSTNETNDGLPVLVPPQHRS